MIYVGTAGWNIPKEHAGLFPADGSHLERYSQRFPAVEINTSFYRPHQPRTYTRWGHSVPQGFRFAVKVPREITHVRRLSGAVERLDSFLGESAALDQKLGPLLVQLPPSLRFDSGLAETFFNALRGRFSGGVVCEPRHPSWFTPEAGDLLSSYQAARAAADPAVHPLAAEPGGWQDLVYYRLHGSPRIYHSAYPAETLDRVALKLAEAAGLGAEVWCIFDNTAEGAAIVNALEMLKRLSHLTIVWTKHHQT
jgi:uncharacterized protein YecE (DUF72 family)